MALRTVQARHFEIKVLLNSSCLGTMPNAQWPDFPEASHRHALRSIIEKALFHYDAMADLEATAVAASTQLEPRYRVFPERLHSADNIIAWLKLSKFLDAINILGPSRELELRQIRRATRNLQRKYITALLDEDLFGLLALAKLARQGFRKWAWLNDQGPNIENWNHPEEAFIETLLRHGSWFLFSHVRGYGPRSTQGSGLLKLVKTELQGESGVSLRTRRPLYSTVKSEVARRLMLKPDDVVEVQGLVEVDEMIRGKQFVRPMTFAFASPHYE